jgi:hypothetical protein
LHGNTCACILEHKSGYAHAYSQANKPKSSDSLRQFARDWGISRKLIVCCTDDIDLHVSSPGQPREIPTEIITQEMHMKWFRVMQSTNMPKQLWDYGAVWFCEFMQRTASLSYHSNGRTLIEIITGDTPNISECLDFAFHD